MKKFPRPVATRLPIYLHILRSESTSDSMYVSSAAIAKTAGLGEVQVRKDLALVSGGGKPKLGYVKAELINDLENCLDCAREKVAVVIGAGKLGKALLSYENFSEYNISVKAAFDINEEKFTDDYHGKKILDLNTLESYCKNENVEIAIITVPASSAQDIADKLVSIGIRFIWSFAPTRLKVPKGVALKEENIVASLAVLAANI